MNNIGEGERERENESEIKASLTFTYHPCLNDASEGREGEREGKKLSIGVRLYLRVGN